MDEINELPKGWATVALGKITEINPKLPLNEIDDELEVSFLPMKLIAEVSNKIELSETRKYKYVKKGFTPMYDGDVIFAKITPCMENGKIAVVNSLKNCIAFGSTEFHVFRCTEAILNQYLFYYLINAQFRQDAQYQMTGAVGQKRVPKKYLEDYSISLPPLAEQRRIVIKIEDNFCKLDKGIENLKTAQEQLKIYRQAVLKWAFEGKLTNDEVNDEDLPEGWNRRLLKEICDIKGGVTKGRNLKGKATIQLPYLRVANVQDGFLDLSEMKTIEVLPSDQDKYRLERGDILYTEGGDKDKFGRGCVWKGEIKNCIHQNHIFRARPSSNTIYSEYISYFSQTKNAKDYFFLHGKQTTNLASINMTILSNLPFVLPPTLSEQKLIVAEIESRLSVCDKLEESITQSLQQAEALRQSILKKAFEGKLVPQNPNDESASVLLERIRAERAATVAKNATVRTRGRPARKQS